MSETPLISLVIPVRNGEEHLDECLTAVRELDWPHERLEVIVVDNASRDRSAEVAKAHGATVMHEATPGAANARNTGWRAARGALIAFTDCDCQPRPDWLRRLFPAFYDPKIGCAGGHLEPAAPRSTVEAYIIEREILSQERALRDEPMSPPFLVTANAAYRKCALEDVDGFDPAMNINGEDADLTWRVVWAGWEIASVPEAVVVHHHRADLRGLCRQLSSYGAGTSQLFHKHHERLGFKRFTLKEPYFEALRGLVLTPFALVFARTNLRRMMPLYDFLGMSSYVFGKLRTSVRLKVWNV